jgi:hypothetical protein
MFGVARSEDYLEKIFQIPLWLRKMDASAARRMVQGLLRGSVAATSPHATPALLADAETDRTAATATPSADAPAPSTPADAIGAADVTARSPITPTPAPSTTPPPAPDSPPPTPPEPLKIVPNLESLQVRDFELSAIDGLSPLLGRSPRALKRFVNLYRLIKAGLTPTEHNAFIRQHDQGFADFEAVLFLLAVDTGLPRVSRALFDALLAMNLDPEANDPDLKHLMQALEKHDAAKTADWTTLREWFTARQRSEAFGTASIRRLATWVPRVSRYSFQAAHLEATRTPPSRPRAVKKASA